MGIVPGEEIIRRIAADVKMGAGVRIHDFVNLYGCVLGANTQVGAFVEIQKGAAIGKNCKISSHTFICQGVTIEDEVFIGHHVTFTNDLYPRAANREGRLQSSSDWVCVQTLVEKKASIGSGSTVLCGITIGAAAIVGAGSVVTQNVPARTVVAGNPARVIRTLAEDCD